jgi:hypothetical protein
MSHRRHQLAVGQPIAGQLVSDDHPRHVSQILEQLAEGHAQWWDAEADQAHQRLAVNDTTLAHARSAFGKIGSSTIGAAMAETLQARHDAGQRLGAYAQDVATHIRRSLNDYRGAENTNTRLLAASTLATQHRGGRSATATPVSDGPHEHQPLPPIDPSGINHITDIPGMFDDGEGGVFWIPGNGMVF